MRIAVYNTRKNGNDYYSLSLRFNDREIALLMGDSVLIQPKVEDEIYVKIDTADIKNLKISLSTADDPLSYKISMTKGANKLAGLVYIPVTKFGKQLFLTKLKARDPVSISSKPKEIVADISNLKPQVVTREHILQRRQTNQNKNVVNNAPVQANPSKLDVENIQNQVMANLVAMGLKVNTNNSVSIGKSAEVQVTSNKTVGAKKKVVLHRQDMLGALISTTDNVDIVDEQGNLLVSC